jgi:hypothetical protein
MPKSEKCSVDPKLYKSKGNYHVLTTSQKAGLIGLYKKFLLVSTMAKSQPVFLKVDGTVIFTITFIME